MATCGSVTQNFFSCSNFGSYLKENPGTTYDLFVVVGAIIMAIGVIIACVYQGYPVAYANNLLACYFFIATVCLLAIPTVDRAIVICCRYLLRCIEQAEKNAIIPKNHSENLQSN